MSFNLGAALSGGLQGLILGHNPISAVAGAVSGGFGGGTTAAGTAGNSLNDMSTGAILSGYTALGVENQAFELTLAGQSQQFNQMTEEKSEMMREQNELRTLAMEQRKADDAITKEFREPLDSLAGVC